MNLEVFFFIAMSNFVRKYFKGNKTHFITSKISDWTQLAIKRMPSFKTKMFYLQSLMDYQLIQWRHPNIQNDHKSSSQVHSFWGNIFIVKYLPQVSLVERALVVTIIVFRFRRLPSHVLSNSVKIKLINDVCRNTYQTRPSDHIYLPRAI